MTLYDALCVLAALAVVVPAAVAGWLLSKPRRVCGPSCKHPREATVPTVSDRYVVCETCPVRDLCTDDMDVKPCGARRGEPPVT